MGLRFLTAGESHGPALLAILEGIPAGLPLNQEMINADLKRRQSGPGAGDRMKIEKDAVQIMSGVMGGATTGAPIALMIENRDHASWVNREVKAYTTPRPGHADLSGAVKYNHTDLRPVLERASARETAARVAVGAVCRNLLAQFGVRIGGYLCSLGPIEADLAAIPLEDRFALAQENELRCPDASTAAAMRAQIDQIIAEGETLGGIIEVVALNVPPGLGSHVHWDRKLDSQIGAAILGIQAMKGVEIGPAFENTRQRGTHVHDPILLEDGRLVRPTSRSGGLEGGISTGQPLIVRAAMKPIATTVKPQPSVNLASGVPSPIQYERSDYTPVIRAIGVVEAMLAFVLANALLEKLGGDSMHEIMPRFHNLRNMDLNAFHMDNQPHVWWPAV